MPVPTRACSRVISLVAAILFVVATPATAGAVSDPGTLFPGTTSSGKYANLTARWWQWVLAQPAVQMMTNNTFPLLDTTGEFAAVGQADGIGPGDKFFFLAGAFGGTVERTVTVPRGKALFFPIINIETDNAVELDPVTGEAPNYTVPELRAQAEAVIDTTTRLHAQLNNKPVKIFRTTSPTFGYTVPEENSIYDHFGLVGPQYEGRIRPAVSDGYWAYIPPLLRANMS